MAQAFAKQFYNSKAWKQTSKLYAASVFFICEKCGRQGYICHHIVHLTPDNITNPDITLSMDNLMYLCLECHNTIHGKQTENRKAVFDSHGNMIGLTEKSIESPPNP